MGTFRARSVVARISWVLLPVALVSGAIVYLRADRIAEPAKIAAKGLATVRLEDGFGFAFLALSAGLLSGALYLWLAGRWPQAASTGYAVGGVALAVGLSVAAAILRPRFGLAGVPEVVLLNLVWGLGFGLALPWVLDGARFRVRGTMRSDSDGFPA